MKVKQMIRFITLNMIDATNKIGSLADMIQEFSVIDIDNLCPQSIYKHLDQMITTTAESLDALRRAQLVLFRYMEEKSELKKTSSDSN